VSIRVSEAGTGTAALLLHGGGGPATVESIATHIAETQRTLTPTHPVWNRSPRPAWLTRIEDLAAAYLNVLSELDLADVFVVGSSLGGWIAAETGEQGRVISRMTVETATARTPLAGSWAAAAAHRALR
jgi:pimeloyl-ACP methyl ester carboxylesterase